jgi:hypothetical protein
VLLGVLLALTCAALTNASFLLRQRGAAQSPGIDMHHPLHSVRCLFQSRWWTIGWLAAFVAWLLHVGALAVMQLSLVQAIIAGGLVFLAVLGQRFFGGVATTPSFTLAGGRGRRRRTYIAGRHGQPVCSRKRSTGDSLIGMACSRSAVTR